MIKAVLFDMDGLLVDSEPIWRKAEIAVFGKYGIYLTEDDCRMMMGRRLNEVVVHWFNKKEIPGIELETVEAEILASVTHLIRTDAEALPGVHMAVDLAKSLGLKTAIASSSPLILIETVVEKLGISSKLDTIHSAQFEKHGKPDPAVFLTTAKQLQTAPENCLVLEDSYYGMLAGLNADMRVIVVPAVEQYIDSRFNEAFAKLNSLNELVLSHFQ